MPLSPGTTLGPYQVTAKIGQGGMGEVYQARDTKLDRDVALKVLPEAFTSDPDRLARFEREAKVLASLNHPNIGTIYGLEEADGVKALVLELVEGPTLADRIKQGPIPIDEALHIATQIAEALEAAHEQGVIHRDLKPANVKVKDDGTVKVLDFGLAKAFQPDASDPGLSASPTISLTAAATQMGMIIGTAAYMSPEQAKGKVVDKRADVWAFGAVLYEMLTGQKPFTGKDASDTLAAVLRIEADLNALPEETPPRLSQLLKACLQKEPKDRVRDIGDVSLAMRGTFESTISASVPAVVPSQLPVWQRPVAIAMMVLASVALTSLTAWMLTRPAVIQPDLMRFVIAPPEAAPLSFTLLWRDVAISPDGTQIIYSDGAADTQLSLRSIDQVAGAPLRGGQGGDPFVSPDGAWVGFHTADSFPTATTLQKVSMFGGPPVTLGESPNTIFGASWGADDQIIFGTNGAGLFRVSGGGGEPEAVTEIDQEQDPPEGGHYWPFIIPDRQAVLFTIASAGAAPLTTAQLAVLDLETGHITQLGLAGVSPHYVSTGHVVYAAEDGSVRAVPFDADRLEVTGNPVPLIERVVVKTSGAANFSLSDNGRLVYVLGGPRGPGGATRLVWVDREGREEPAVPEPRDFQEFSLSPDGTRVAVRVASTDGSADVWVVDLIRQTNTRLTFEGDPSAFPTWTPDGTRVAFGPPLAWKAADGIGTVEPLSESPATVPQAFSPNRGTLVVETQQGGNGDLGMLELEGDGTVTPLLQEDYTERNAALSPDGRWIAYQSDETGQFEIYVRPFPDTESGRRAVSSNGGTQPIWNPAGPELFYRGPDALMAVAFETEPTFTPGAATELFDLTPYRGGGNRRIAVDPEGQRFLLLRFGGDQQPATDVAAPTEINVVLNWTQELLERVPVN